MTVALRVRALVGVFFVVTSLASLRSARAADPADAVQPGRRIAVLVGANDPAPGRQALRYAHSDARLMADTLLRVGRFAKEDVHVLLEPQPGEVLAALDRTSRELQAAGGDSLLVFYYSGHSDGQRVFPHGQALPLADLRDRLKRSSARVRIAIVDTCRGGSWTQAKGLSVGPPLDAMDLMNVSTEGTALLSSSSGMESAHEAGALHGSFFTHHLAAGLLGAADASGDGNVSLQEVFLYAKERTVRDSAQMATTTQHPSFDMQLRGRQDIVLARTSASKSALLITQTDALQVIHLSSGAMVAETPAGARQLRLALVPGRYIVRRVAADGHVRSKQVDIGANATVTLTDAQLDTVSGGALAMKSSDDPEEPKPSAESQPVATKPATPAAPAPCTPCCDSCRCEDGDDRKDDDERETDDDHERKHRKDCKDGRCRSKSHSWRWDRDGVAGIRGLLTQTNGSDKDGTYIGATFTVAGEHYDTRGLWSHRGSIRMSLGGGSAGLEGSLGGAAAVGLRLPVGEHHGPIARIGAEGELMGNSRFYFSHLELPLGEVGYQYLDKTTIVEAGGRAAPVITGRYNTGNATRRELGGGVAEVGGYVAVHLPFGRVDASYAHMAAGENPPGGDVHVLRGWLCGYAVQHLAICVDGMFLDAKSVLPDIVVGNTVQGGNPSRVQSFFGGLTVGGTY